MPKSHISLSPRGRQSTAWQQGCYEITNNPFSALKVSIHTTLTLSQAATQVSLTTCFGLGLFALPCSSAGYPRLTPCPLGGEELLAGSCLLSGQGSPRTGLLVPKSLGVERCANEPAKPFLHANIPEDAGTLLSTAPKCLSSELTTSYTPLPSLANSHFFLVLPTEQRRPFVVEERLIV